MCYHMYWKSATPIYSVLLVLCSSTFAVDFPLLPQSFNTKCLKDSNIDQREQLADIVLNARVAFISKDDRESTMYDCTLSIYRIMKGSDLVGTMLGNPKTFYRELINVTGFGNPKICDSDVVLGDMRIFMITEDDSGYLTLNSSLIRLGIRTLGRSQLRMPNDAPANLVEPIISACKFFYCAFYAECKTGPLTNDPYCECPSCIGEREDEIMCGNDGRWYTNRCQMRKASCIKRRRIYKSVTLKCKAAGPAPTTEPWIFTSTMTWYYTKQPLKTLATEKPTSTPKPTIPTATQTIASTTMPTTVPTTTQTTSIATLSTTTAAYTSITALTSTSASDFTSSEFSSVAEDSENATKPSPPIQAETTTYSQNFTGETDPCDSKDCKYGAICQRPIAGEGARCECPEFCDTYGDSLQDRAVCGTDGRDYKNECELRKYTCTNLLPITVKHSGKCDPCEDHRCPELQVCSVNPSSYEPYCHCINNCSANVEDPVCGTDNVLYDSDCMLRYTACVREDYSLSVAYRGECKFGGRNPCDSILCSYGAICRILDAGNATCMCRDCSKEEAHVCGSDGRTYRNQCHLEAEACRTKKNITTKANMACDEDMCLNTTCEYDAVCELVVIDESRPPQPNCVCPSCSPLIHPVCGDDGITYDTECHMRAENCQQRSKVRISHEGMCSKCASTACEFGGVCHNRNGTAVCLCPDDACIQAYRPVCGDDGVTYDSMCQLTVQSCKNQRTILKVKDTACDGNTCQRENPCLYQGVCVGRSCLCDWSCGTALPVCGTDGVTYASTCHMEKAACNQQTEIKAASSGSCDEMMGGSGGEDGDGEDGDDSVFPPSNMFGTSTRPSDKFCDTRSNCKFGGVCDYSNDENGICRCIFTHCQEDLRVCGSDGEFYKNICALRNRTCEIQQDLGTRQDDFCIRNGYPSDVALCYDNSLPKSGYNCSACLPDWVGDCEFCPQNHYCNKGYCCKKDEKKPDCTYTKFGCCPSPDDTIVSPGPDNSGCPSFMNNPDTCQCNEVGSYSETCDPKTYQCDCKSGVGGPACTMCQVGFYGHALIATAGLSGCLPCQCSEDGSLREDCEQTLGRCLCKLGVGGLKCDSCIDPAMKLTADGCVFPDLVLVETCETKECPDSARCAMSEDMQAECTCEFDCGKEQTLVCGSDMVTYNSTCHLEQTNCLRSGGLEKVKDEACDEPTTSTSSATVTTTTESELTTTDATTAKDSDSWWWWEKARADEPYKKRDESSVAKHPVEATCDDSPCNNLATCMNDPVQGYFCICTVFWTGKKCETPNSFTAPHFTGGSFIKVVGWFDQGSKFDLRLAIIPISTNGIILYAGDIEGRDDFVSLVLNDGYLEYRFDNGDGIAEITSPEKLKLYKKYEIKLYKDEKKGLLRITGMGEKIGFTLGRKTRLDVGIEIFLGKIESAFYTTRLRRNLGQVTQGFEGCITELRDAASNLDFELRSVNTSLIADGRNIKQCNGDPCLESPCANGGLCDMIDSFNFYCTCLRPYKGERCTERSKSTRHLLSNEEYIVPTVRFTGKGYSLYRLRPRLSANFTMGVVFLTKHQDGVLVFSSQRADGTGDFLLIMVEEHKLTVKYNIGNGVRYLRTSENVTTDEWHFAFFKREGETCFLSLDQSTPTQVKITGSMREMNVGDTVSLGGIPSRVQPTEIYLHSQALHGLIQRVEVNGMDIGDLFTTSTEQFSVKHFRGAPCHPNPCPSRHICLPLLDNFECIKEKRV